MSVKSLLDKKLVDKVFFASDQVEHHTTYVPPIVVCHHHHYHRLHQDPHDCSS